MTHATNAVWQKRKTQLKSSMVQVKRQTRRQANRRGLTTADRHLLDKLIEFLDTTFDFIYDGLDADTGKRTLGKKFGILFNSKSEKEAFFGDGSLPADTLYAELLRQVSIDFLRIKQAADQPDSQVANVAGWLAQRALLPSQRARLMCHGQSYLNLTVYPASLVEIRLLPYSHGALIGFPVTAFSDLTAESDADLDLSMSFLTLAHECAHVVYRSGRIYESYQGRLLKDDLNHKLAIQLAKDRVDIVASDWMFDWLEEIFCDAYGCFVEGPVFVAGFHDVMGTDYPTDTHSHHDCDHPIPALRPLIISRIMNSIVKLWTDDARAHDSIDLITAKLDQAWIESVLKDWPDWAAEVWPYGIPDPEKDGIDGVSGATYEVNGEPKSGLTILEELQPVIDLILGEMKDLQMGKLRVTWDTDPAVWQMMPPAEVVDKLHHNYVRSVQKVFQNGGLTEEEIGMNYDEFSQNQAPFPISDPIASADDPSLALVIDKIMSNGWSTEGPRTNPGGGSGFG